MPYWLLYLLIFLCLAGLPSSLAVAWWFWFRGSSYLPSTGWRKGLLLSALLTNSLNLFLYGSYDLYWTKLVHASNWVKMREAGVHVGFWLLLWGLIGGLFGQGRLRFLLMLNCLLGILLWFPDAFSWLA
jgi:hypothetical protein